MDESLIRKAKEYIAELFRDNSDGHDLDHSLRVYSNAMLIARSEPECDIEAVALAALLHDADDHKLFDTTDFSNARRFLADCGISAEKTELICSAIASVSFSKNRGVKPSTPEGMIVQDADRLDAMGAVGIARTFAYGGSHGRSLEGGIEHFHEKLLLLRDEMNTETARRIAGSRHAFMEEFLGKFEEETGIK